MAKKFGLIGYPLGHTFSKTYFDGKFEKEKIGDHEYVVLPLESLDNFQQLLYGHPELCGLNVTIPHKIKVINQLDWLSDDAKKVGAVNCIRVSFESPVAAAFTGELGVVGHDFRLEGFNTDIYGFKASLQPLLTSNHKQALVLGNGGAAKAVKYVLDDLDISYRVVVRKPGDGVILFDDLKNEDIANSKLIINTTPLGTSPKVDEYPPIPYDAITPEHLLFDLVYNPEQTTFLTKGLEKGASIKNGYEMLVLQAEKAWEIWNTKAAHV